MSAPRFLSVADAMAIEALPEGTRRVLALYLADAFEAGYREGFRDAGATRGTTGRGAGHARREWIERTAPSVLGVEVA